MSLRLHPVEEQLEHADRRWRAIRFLTHTATIACVIAGLFLIIGLLVIGGLLTSTIWALILLIAGTGASVLAWAVVALLVWAAPVQRARLAAAIERAHPSLLDRLNTIAHLERSPSPSPLIAPIAVQAASVLKHSPPGPTFRTARAWWHWCAFVSLALLTIWFYRLALPWERLRAAEAAQVVEQITPEGLVLPPDASADGQGVAPEDSIWGEVHISEPGADIRAAEFEMVPLQIEAATSEPQQKVKLVTAVNGGQPNEQHFTPAQDPTYAIYESELVLPVLGVKQWDVVSYYAEALTKDGKSYKSDLYFIEVFPLSEDLKQVPGGEQGAVYRTLQELTALTQRQQEVVRTQHRLDQLPPEEAARRQLGYGQLTVDEQRLAEAAQRLAAAARAQWQNDPELKKWLEKLDEAGQSLDTAHESLQQQGDQIALPVTLDALRALLAARAALQEMARQFPDRFKNNSLLASSAGGGSQTQMLPSPTAEQLQQAREQAQKIADEQQQLAERTRSEPLAPLAPRQEELEQQLAKMPADSPEATSVVPEPFVSALESASESAQKLEGEHSDAPDTTDHAATQAEELARQLEQHEMLKQIADRIDALKNIEQQPQQFDDAAMKKQAEETQKLVERLQQFAEQHPEHSQQMSQHLNDPNERESLQAACQKMGNCQNDGEKTGAAGAARQGLEQLGEGLGMDQAQSTASQHHQNLERQLGSMESRESSINAARDAVRGMLTSQRDLQRQSSGGDHLNTSQQLANAQEQNLNAFRQTEQQHQDVMRDVPKQTQRASDSLHEATAAMRSGQPAHDQAEQAGDALQDLDTSLDQLKQQGNVADVFRFQEMMQRHLRHLQNLQQSPEKFSPEQFQQAAQDSQRMAKQAQQLGQSPGVKESLGEDLAKATGEQQMQRIEQASQELQNATSDPQRQAALEKLRNELREVSKSMGQSMGQQSSGGMGAGRDILQESGYQAIARGLREMETLAGAQQGRMQLTPQQQQQLRSDAASQLAGGISDIYGHNERSEELIKRLQEELVEQKTPVDMETIRQLMSEIQDLRRESRLDEAASEEPAELQNVDPSRLPPAYRRSIERYFQKLSEDE